MTDQDQQSEEPEAPSSPDPKAIEAFWLTARTRVGHAKLEVILGQQAEAVITPPSMHLSSVASEATSLATDLIEQGVMTTTLPADEYGEDSDSLPQIGDLAIICDGEGRPVALVRTVNTVTSVGSDGRIFEETLRTLFPSKQLRV